jgi:hypothetical protein
MSIPETHFSNFCTTTFFIVINSNFNIVYFLENYKLLLAKFPIPNFTHFRKVLWKMKHELSLYALELIL